MQAAGQERATTKHTAVRVFIRVNVGGGGDYSLHEPHNTKAVAAVLLLKVNGAHKSRDRGTHAAAFYSQGQNKASWALEISAGLQN